jgi:tRNA threonylcarbamoyladenosine biosynthesis protein TsaE
MQLRTATASETERLGAKLARSRPAPGDAPAIIFLIGELGAGKTTLARGFLHECGIEGAVRSPTYTLVEIYEQAGLCILHIDLYRLADAGDLESLGLREWLRPEAIWLIEWPERAVKGLPTADLSVTLRAEPAAHEITIESGTARGVRWLERSVRAVEMTAPGT